MFYSENSYWETMYFIVQNQTKSKGVYTFVWSETTRSQIERIEINYDAHINMVRQRTGRTHTVGRIWLHDTFLKSFFLFLYFNRKMR